MPSTIRGVVKLAGQEIITIDLQEVEDASSPPPVQATTTERSVESTPTSTAQQPPPPSSPSNTVMTAQWEAHLLAKSVISNSYPDEVDCTSFLERQRKIIGNNPAWYNLAALDVCKMIVCAHSKGKYATVCRAVHKKTGIQYAAKFVKKRRRNQDQMKEIIHEIAVLMQCANTGRVIRLHEVYESATEMVLVLELAAGGELQHILDGGQCLGEIEARKAMRQILEGVSFLHERNIAHLDLKPQNLLLALEDCCDDIKLCDFGISKVLEPGVKVREILGTVDYVAPEVLSYEPIELSTDIWSVGVLAYVLLSGFSPFGADDKQQTFLNISKCALSFEAELFEDVSSAAIDFIKCALVIDPRKRPTVQELLDHPWISLKTNLLKLPSVTTTVAIKSNETTPKSTPISQRKSLSCITDTTPKSQRKLCSDQKINGSFTDSTVRTYTANCLCPQCGTTCRHLTHTPVSKTPITVDRGILC